MTSQQQTALIEVLNYLADEEQHYESCNEDEKLNHIWRHCEVLRAIIEL